MEDIISRRAREALGDTKRRCTATNRSGEQCGRPPIAGGLVCFVHGGNAPMVRRAAKERLLTLVEPALDYLVRMFESRPPCEHCGRSDADRDPVVLRAVQMILDRTGFHPAVTIDTPSPATESADWVRWLPYGRGQQLLEWIAEAKAAMAAGEPDATEIINAGLVYEADAELAHREQDLGVLPGEA